MSRSEYFIGNIIEPMTCDAHRHFVKNFTLYYTTSFCAASRHRLPSPEGRDFVKNFTLYYTTCNYPQFVHR